MENEPFNIEVIIVLVACIGGLFAVDMFFTGVMVTPCKLAILAYYCIAWIIIARRSDNTLPLRKSRPKDSEKQKWKIREDMGGILIDFMWKSAVGVSVFAISGALAYVVFVYLNTINPPETICAEGYIIGWMIGGAGAFIAVWAIIGLKEILKP